MKELKIENQTILFEFCPICFLQENKINCFSYYDKKTVEETIQKKRYQKLENLIHQNYIEQKTQPLGKFLLDLKTNGDSTYQLFLNPYGDLSYCTFFLKDKNKSKLKGLYAYYLKDELVYIGRCLDQYSKRMNQGYGKICPKNCYKDGQATNCHLNHLINENRNEIALYLHPMDQKEQIVQLEAKLVNYYQPKWNIQLQIKEK